MENIKVEELEIVYRSDIQPKVLQAFIDGYICEHANKTPYRYTKELGEVYPGFETWFKAKVEPGLKSDVPDRELILLMAPEDGVVAGFAILKRTAKEKKICTFRISEGWRSEGAGQRLMRACFGYLGTDKPLITVSDKCKDSFEKIFRQFDFRQTQVIPDLYVSGSREYVFNGYLDTEKP